MPATDPNSLAQRVADLLNGAGSAGLTALCSPDVAVFAPITEESLDPFARRDPSKLLEFAEAFRQAFPDLRASAGTVAASAERVTVKWSARGTHRKALGYIQPCGQALEFGGSCAFKLEAGLVSEIRLAADVYDLLLKTGSLCADPAQPRGQSATVNRAAMEALGKAITGRATDVGAPFDKDTQLHAAVRFYSNSEFEQGAFDAAGAGQLPVLLGFLRAQFSALELELDQGISQGHTTTFRGKARATRAGERLCYQFRAGFRSSGPRIVESWVEVQLPPTLREAFA